MQTATLQIIFLDCISRRMMYRAYRKWTLTAASFLKASHDTVRADFQKIIAILEQTIRMTEANVCSLGPTTEL